jgi:hypothetical protein
MKRPDFIVQVSNMDHSDFGDVVFQVLRVSSILQDLIWPQLGRPDSAHAEVY